MRTEDNAEAVDSLAQNLEGSFGLSWTMSNDTHGNIRDIVFNDGGNGFTSGRAALSRWYVGTEYLPTPSDPPSVRERVLKGCIPLEYSQTYTQGGEIRESLTMGYADEERNTSITPTGVSRATNGNDVPFHGCQLDADGAQVSLLQSATLSISNMYRFYRDETPTPADATLAAPTTTLELEAIYDEQQDTQLGIAYGSTSSPTSTQDRLEAIPLTLSYDVQGNTVAEYSLPSCKPQSTSWNSLIDGENNLTQSQTFHVNGGVSIA
ncbi:phage tail tube protein [Halomicroarcula sp. GCM10025709]